MCCGKTLVPLTAEKADESHTPVECEIEDDYYIEFGHEMTKERFISFVAFVCADRILTIKLYPEQNASVRFAKMYGGKLYIYCTEHGLFEFSLKR